jgi:TolA-binding protein
MARVRVLRHAVIAALLAVGALAPGCRCLPGPPEEDYREGLRLFLAQKYGAAEPRLRAALDEQPTAAQAAEIHYLLGAIALRRGSTQEAALHFQACLRAPSNEQLSTNAALGLARCHYQGGEYRQCREDCLDILRSNPASPRADEACFLLAEASERAGLHADAQEAYRKVVSMQSSRWAGLAAKRLGGGSTAPPPSPPPAPSGRYFVQVAALSSAPRAAEQAKSLRDRGYAASVVRARVGGEDLHTVQVGPFASRAEAERMVARLKAEGVGSPIIKP